MLSKIIQNVEKHLKGRGICKRENSDPTFTQSLIHTSQSCFSSSVFQLSDGPTIHSSTNPRSLGIILNACFNLFLHLITHIKVLTLPLKLLQNFTFYSHNYSLAWRKKHSSFPTLQLFSLFCKIGRINCKWTVEQTKV